MASTANPSSEAVRAERKTPFLDLVPFEAERGNGQEQILASVPTVGTWSPFTALYEVGNGAVAAEPVDSSMNALAAELYDDEFTASLNELMAEVLETQEQIEREIGPTPAHGPAGEQRLQRFVDTLALEVQRLLETIGENSDGRDLTDSEVESIIDTHLSTAHFSPQLQHFLGNAVKSLWNKAKKVASTAVKTVAKTALRPVLNKLIPLVRPLLQRVLQMAIGKLPPAVQPVAKQLAAKYLKLSTEAESSNEPVAGFVDIPGLQREFDDLLVRLVTTETDMENEVLTTEYAREADDTADPVERLNEARNHFADRLRALKVDEDPTPAIQEFVPAILPALRLGIRLVGRSKVVEFLAKLVAKLISRFVGPKYAPALSQALVDVGLRLITLETTPDDVDRVTAEVVAGTVEETVRRVAALPEYMLDHPDLLEPVVVNAFEEAAAATLPQVLPDAVYAARPELRESSDLKGAWIPQGGEGRTYYDKYSIEPEVEITPHVARQVRTFGGAPLAAFMRDRLGIEPGRTVSARVHMYRTRPGSWRGRIAKRERRVPGLGRAIAIVRDQLHPLTPAAAGALLKEPGLGAEVTSEQMADGDINTVGQRFYYLEIPGARPQAAPGTLAEGRRWSEVNVKVDFARDEIVEAMYLSESDAQAVASKLRQRAPIGYAVNLITAVVEDRLKAALGEASGHIRFIHGSFTPQDMLGSAVLKLPVAAKDALGLRLRDWLGRRLSERLESLSAEFEAATEQPTDGLSLLVTFKNPPGLVALRRVLSGEPPGLRNGWFAPGTPDATIRIVPGFSRG